MRIDGDKLKDARMASGLTEFEASQAAKIAFATYTGLENYGGTIRKDAGERLALTLNVKVTDIEADKSKAKASKAAVTEPEAESPAVEQPQPDDVDPQEAEETVNTRRESFFIKFYRRDFAEQARVEVLIRSDILTTLAKDTKYPKIWISYETRNGINSFSEIYDTPAERDERWADIMQALLFGMRERL